MQDNAEIPFLPTVLDLLRHFLFFSLAYHLSFWPTTGRPLGKLDCVGWKRVLWGQRGDLDEAASDSTRQSSWNKMPVWQTAGATWSARPLQCWCVRQKEKKGQESRRLFTIYWTHISLHEVLMTGRKRWPSRIVLWLKHHRDRIIQYSKNTNVSPFGKRSNK